MPEDLVDTMEKVAVGEKAEEEEGQDVVTPWEVKTSSEKGIDYMKLIGELVLCVIFPSLGRIWLKSCDFFSIFCHFDVSCHNY